MVVYEGPVRTKVVGALLGVLGVVGFLAHWWLSVDNEGERTQCASNESSQMWGDVLRGEGKEYDTIRRPGSESSLGSESSSGSDRASCPGEPSTWVRLAWLAAAVAGGVVFAIGANWERRSVAALRIQADARARAREAHAVSPSVAALPGGAGGARTRACPWCAETVLAAAIRCKHCHGEIEPDPSRLPG